MHNQCTEYRHLIFFASSFELHHFCNSKMEQVIPFERKIQKEEQWLYSNPRTDSYVPASVLWPIVFSAPTIVFIIYFLFSRNKLEFIQACLAVTIALGLNGILTNSLKLTVGKLICHRILRTERGPALTICSLHFFFFVILQEDLVPISWNAVSQMVSSMMKWNALANWWTLLKVAKAFPVAIHHVSDNFTIFALDLIIFLVTPNIDTFNFSFRLNVQSHLPVCALSPGTWWENCTCLAIVDEPGHGHYAYQLHPFLAHYSLPSAEHVTIIIIGKT